MFVISHLPNYGLGRICSMNIFMVQLVSNSTVIFVEQYDKNKRFCSLAVFGFGVEDVEHFLGGAS